MFNLQNSISSVGGRVMYLECILLASGAPHPVMLQRLFYILLAPFAVLVSATFWCCNYRLRRAGCVGVMRGRTWPQIRRAVRANFLTTCIVAVFLLHPTITEKVRSWC